MLNLKEIPARITLIFIGRHIPKNSSRRDRNRDPAHPADRSRWVSAYHDAMSSLPILRIAFVAFAYLVGMLQSAELIGRMIGRDPRREGSRNPGASNMYRIAGRNAAAITLTLDVLKAFVPALIAHLSFGIGWGLATGAAAVIGHIFPAIRGFRGGKGVATFGGMALALWPVVAMVTFLVWMTTLKITHRSSVASLIGVTATVIGVALSGFEPPIVGGAAAVGALIIIKHESNIRRLISGDELSVNHPSVPEDSA